MSHPHHLKSHESVLLVVDVQEKLVPKIPNSAELIRNLAFLIDVARILDVHVAATEQYPKGLGPTVAPLLEKLPERPDKKTFSCCGIPGLVENFQIQKKGQVILAGIETHVCILHTAIDLLRAGFQVFLPIDALGSRFMVDHETALKRLSSAGAVLTTSETTAFEWLCGADHPHFKAVSALIQERMKGILA